MDINGDIIMQNITIVKQIINNEISFKFDHMYFLSLYFFKIINKNGNMNNTIPVGFVKKTKAKEMPDKILYLYPFESFKYQFVKNNKFKVLNEVRDKSIK